MLTWPTDHGMPRVMWLLSWSPRVSEAVLYGNLPLSAAQVLIWVFSIHSYNGADKQWYYGVKELGKTMEQKQHFSFLEKCHSNITQQSPAYEKVKI